MGRRHRTSVSISLFSFQDIITCLSGVMILLVLLITLDIATRKLSGEFQFKPESDSFRQTPPGKFLPESSSLLSKIFLETSLETSLKIPLEQATSDGTNSIQALLKELNRMIENLNARHASDAVNMAELTANIEYGIRHLIEQQNSLKRSIKKFEQQHSYFEKKKKEIQRREGELESRLAELKKMHDALSWNNSITLIPEKGSGIQQKPLVVECAGNTIRRVELDTVRQEEVNTVRQEELDTIRQGELDTIHRRKRDTIHRRDVTRNRDANIFSTDTNGIQQFLNSLTSVNKADEYLLFMIKPSASDYAMQLIGQVQQMGFDVGYDAMLEEQVLSFGIHHLSVDTF